MEIKKVVLRQIKLPLTSPFQTHQGTITDRSLIIVELEDHSGRRGYGEVTAFATPFYTYETTSTAWRVLIDFLIPQIPFEDLQHPGQLAESYKSIQGHPMAKAGLEGAMWDLYSKQQGESLSEVIGGTQKKVSAGAVLSLSESLESDIKRLKETGYKRYKLKIKSGQEEGLIRAVKRVDPELPIMIDANGMYSEEDIPHLLELDRYGLMMIEQPFQAGDFYLHQNLQQQMKTPICLDESVMSYHDAMQAVELSSCEIINVKISRVGGLTEALRIHDFCREKNIPVWCGGMVESGVSKAHNLALASLPNFSIPGDLSSSTRYFAKDIIKPGIEVENGEIEVPDQPGIGVEIDYDYLSEVTLTTYQFNF
ncbi:o-succinylbenzoate synthase [Halobacillus sp. BBL2006]|uniref:o-succinylbenzoate synthase n=1 Tax=Halobacillus sp. BBL2006 TaxID=1543706 RepID=UPI0005435E39|nr:o-succinylbenzoate synthase [Halobacillus sp. BBL2006]KHE68249.1 N-acylamino acid racemase [Halobacillus sp. BBL2006]